MLAGTLDQPMQEPRLHGCWRRSPAGRPLRTQGSAHADGGETVPHEVRDDIGQSIDARAESSTA
jgi:hypothetical protein